VSHAAVATEHTDPVVPVEKTPFGITNGKFGMWMFLCQDCMGFVGLFAAYAGLRALADKWYDPNVVLGIPFTAVMTFVLICSSVTMVLALDACQRGDQKGLKKWLGFTILGGVFFLGGQVYEYQMLLSEEWRRPAAHNFWATFYSLTSFHGLHVLGGVIYLTCMWIGAAKGKYGPLNSTPIEIVGLYWHFVDLVWILLFTFVYLIAPEAGAVLPPPVAGGH
jgi:heme/copper-type cytochrome/quinol oxidase subunit 3